MSSFLCRSSGGSIDPSVLLAYMRKAVYDTDLNDIVDNSEKLNDGTTIITVPEVVTQTDAELHVYADGDTGDDANNGLSVLTPKKTLQAVADLVPYLVNHDVAIHLAGTFTDETMVLDNDVASGKYLVVEGEFDYTKVYGTFTASGSSVSTLTVAGASWTIDAYKGYGVEILTGARAGDIRSIYSNTADTITVNYDFNADPGAITFDIVEPATVINCPVVYGGIKNYCVGGGSVVIQNLKTENRARIINQTDVLNSYIVGILGSGNTTGGYNNSVANQLYYYAKLYIVGTGWNDTGDYVLGCGHLGAVTSNIYISNVESVYIYFSVLNDFDIISSGIFIITNSRLKNLNMYSCNNVSSSPLSIANFNNFDALGRDTIITGSTGSGIVMNGCSNITFDDITISDNTSHGIELISSSIKFLDITVGTGNGGAGVYAHSGSEVTITSGSAPTLTGTVGDIAISNPALEDATWADVDAGSDVAIAQEMTVVKEG